MVTFTPAKVLRMKTTLGTSRPGDAADVAVFESGEG
jgi:predicted amidohydrolase